MKRTKRGTFLMKHPAKASNQSAPTPLKVVILLILFCPA